MIGRAVYEGLDGNVAGSIDSVAYGELVENAAGLIGKAFIGG